MDSISAVQANALSIIGAAVVIGLSLITAANKMMPLIISLIDQTSKQWAAIHSQQAQITVHDNRLNGELDARIKAAADASAAAAVAAHLAATPPPVALAIAAASSTDGSLPAVVAHS